MTKFEFNVKFEDRPFFKKKTDKLEDLDNIIIELKKKFG